MKRLCSGTPNPREFRRDLVRRGWRIVTGGKHQHAVWKSGHKINLPCSPGDHRSIHNLVKLANRIEQERT